MLPVRFIVFVCTYIFAKSDLCGLANGLCIRNLRSCFDMGSVFGGKKTLIYLFYSLSLSLSLSLYSKDFFLFVSLIATRIQ